MKSVKEILDDLEKKSKEKMFIDRIMWCVKPTKTIPSRYVSREEFERVSSLNGKNGLSMNRIDIEDVIRIEKERRAINKFEADEVSLFYKGRRIDLPKEQVDDWKYTGLSLISFIEMIVIPEYTDHEI